MSAKKHSLPTRIVDKFLEGNLSVILIVLAVIAGAAALLLTPREEEPQIEVPLADVYVHMPGASAKEVEKLVATPLEKLLSQIDGVEYVYSMSRRGSAVSRASAVEISRASIPPASISSILAVTAARSAGRPRS